MTDSPPAQRLALSADDGHPIELRLWQPDGTPRAVVQVLHGLAEHVDRYARFAGACTAAGLAVAGHNHRGHGAQSDDGLLGHFADEQGMPKVIDDVARCRHAIDQQFPGAPVVLLGHSMGSYIAQRYVMERQPALAALILSGSTWPNRKEVGFARWLARLLCRLRGRRTPSGLFDALIFKGYNRRFKPNRTAFDWLSRDPAEVDRYVEDPLCGARSSYGLWWDLFDTLMTISTDDALRRIVPGRPLLIVGGEEDPVGGKPALRNLAAEYEANGHDQVTLKLYPEGRHEMLNEVNRDAVTADLLGWIEDALPAAGDRPGETPRAWR